MKKGYEEDDVVFCTVRKIEGTTVFLEIEGGGEGSMVLSEVAAGRIRNLREYVSPNKKVVCKILRIADKNHIELSLRRVTAKEREEMFERHKKERALSSMIRIVGGNPEEIIGQIKEKYGILEFLEEARKNSSVLGEFFSKEHVEKLSKLISEKEGKKKFVEKRFSLKSFSEEGIKEIMFVLNVEGEIRYRGSSVFSLSVFADNYREANSKLDEIFSKIEERAKKKKVLLEIKK